VQKLITHLSTKLSCLIEQVADDGSGPLLKKNTDAGSLVSSCAVPLGKKSAEDSKISNLCSAEKAYKKDVVSIGILVCNAEDAFKKDAVRGSVCTLRHDLEVEDSPISSSMSRSVMTTSKEELVLMDGSSIKLSVSASAKACPSGCVDCINGISNGTNTTCTVAYLGKCCVGGSACNQFTGKVCKDGSCIPSHQHQLSIVAPV